MKKVQDNKGNKYILDVQQKSNNLWRIFIQKIGKFNSLQNQGSIDLAIEKGHPENEVWLSYLDPDGSNVCNEVNEMLWQEAKNLAREQGWNKFYGELTLKMIENKPQRLSWLKKRGFTIKSEVVEENIHFYYLLV